MTDGARSIGSATIARLVARDMMVLVVDKDAHQLGQIADRFKDKIVSFTCDAADPEGPRDLRERRSRLGAAMTGAG